MWTLSDALDVIRPLQFKALQYGYHLALGGGVLNKGESANDLDLIVMPLDQRPCNREKFLAVAAKYLGESTEIGGDAPPSLPEDAVDNLVRFTDHAGRITDLLFYQR